MKIQPYPNSEFNTVDEYADFCREHNVFGQAAYKLKRQIDAMYRIPTPDIRPFEEVKHK